MRLAKFALATVCFVGISSGPAHSTGVPAPPFAGAGAADQAMPASYGYTGIAVPDLPTGRPMKMKGDWVFGRHGACLVRPSGRQTCFRVGTYGDKLRRPEQRPRGGADNVLWFRK